MGDLLAGPERGASYWRSLLATVRRATSWTSNIRVLKAATLLGLAVLAVCAGAGGDLTAKPARPPAGAGERAVARVRERLSLDVAALQAHRPGYPFWRYVFQIPDGEVLFGSARDGRLLARFPARSDWVSGARWEDETLAGALEGRPLAKRLSDRRDQVARLLEPAVGPVVHNETRGDFVLRNVPRFGGFLDEWAAIYERFGAPAEIGLAQAMVESGFSGTVRSRANALGLCQWLKKNWTALDRLTPHVIEVQNQTTQAAYCAAFLTVLATKYGSFIPALSEHHAGAANVGKVLINGERLGAADVRERYFAGSEFAHDLRAVSTRRFRDLVGTYGTRSYLYSEMVFGNVGSVDSLRASVPQERIYAMRTSRALTLREITRATGLSEREVKRFNPALVRQVPRGATLYLPEPAERFGPDVSFWHRPASPEFSETLAEFVALDVGPERWEDPAFESVLVDFRRRFRETQTEEGTVMDAVLGYVLQQIPTTRRVLDQFRASPKVQQAFEAGLEEWRALLGEAEPIS